MRRDVQFLLPFYYMCCCSSAGRSFDGVGSAMPSTAKLKDGATAAATVAAAAEEAAAMRRSRGLDVGMFEAMSKERVQLCLTLEQGADRISVYLGVCAEAWPVGMVPGFCTVQVRGHSCLRRAWFSGGPGCFFVLEYVVASPLASTYHRVILVHDIIVSLHGIGKGTYVFMSDVCIM